MRPPAIGRVVVLAPSGFTLLNLCLGLLAILNAANEEYGTAGLFVLLGGVADAVDGRVARATRSGSRFGEELDSLVDLVSFGVAPAMIMYFLILRGHSMDWIWAFIFVAAAAMRLAKFNVEQAGKRKSHFYGLPSPAAGMTLASYWWFSQTDLYRNTFIEGLPWQHGMRAVMVVLAALMMSTVQYPAVPTVGVRSFRGLLGLGLVVGTLVGLLTVPKEFIFPALLCYVLYGLAKTAIMGLIGKRLPVEAVASSTMVEGASQGLADEDPAMSGHEAGARSPARRRRRRRRRGGGPGKEQSGGNRD